MFSVLKIKTHNLKMLDEIAFTINEKPFTVASNSIPLDTNLNSFIRNQAHLTGTKFMCLEGGCGACIVNVRGIHPVTGELKSWAVNSCLMPIFSCHNLEITTIEGIGNRKDGYHPAQKRLTEFNGTQCGYCSPGMVMNMYSLLESSNGKVTMEEVENSFGGNICRCTGYRPILDAFKSLACDADEKLLARCTDIENLGQQSCCSKNRSSCCLKPCQIPSKKKNLCLEFNNGKSWHKVTTINEIFAIFDQLNSDQEYMLVAGNTAHGVYRRSDNIHAFIDITNVRELHTHQISKENLVIGGSVNLTELMAILTNASKTIGFEYVTELVNHIDLIANVPVRNVTKHTGTIAGNLSIKHEYNEFPSDLFVILNAIDAKLTIAGAKQQKTIVSLDDYLKIDMNRKVIVSVTLPALNSNEYLFRTFKIMPRSQNAHAYVNAGLLIKLKTDGKVDMARICYGGISPDFNHATKTELLLRNQVLHSNETLQNALKSLQDEIQPDWQLPDASPDYRKQLTFGLFYKFVINTSPKDLVAPEYLSGGSILVRPLSTGVQVYDTYEENWPLTQFVPKYEGLIQCSGESKYSNDFPHLPNELWAAFVPATKAHGKVLEINVDDALKIPGVHYFFSAKDIPGVNNFAIEMPDVEEIFLGANSTILFHGQPVGIILADTFELANYATKFVKITYAENENSKIITNIRDALRNRVNQSKNSNSHEDVCSPQCAHRPKGFFCRPRLNNNRKPYKAHSKSTKEIIGKFQMGAQYHYSMETQTAVCIPAEDGIDVHSATQWSDSVQEIISAALKIPSNAINIHFKRLGGAYGAKISRPPQIACAAALACHTLNRPIRFVMTMESNMATIGKRNPCLTQYRINVNSMNGKIESLHNQYYEDSGCDHNDDPTYSTSNAFPNCYIVDDSTWTIDHELITTDTASNTSCRAPGTTEGIGMMEHMMEHIARATNQDPLAVRLANMSADHKLRPIIDNFLKDNEFYKRKTEIDEFNGKNRWTKRGIAIVPMQYTQYYGGTLPAYVAVYQTDGTVVVTHGGIEMGQGINTKVAQVAAHILGVPLKYVKVKECTNVLGANSTITGGSQASEAVCHAVKMACEKILDRMKPVRDELGENAEWIDIVKACFWRNIDLTEKYLFKAPDLKIYHIYGVSAAEVEIDVLTGSLQLRNVDILEDTGESLSPSVDVGQVEGSFIMGVGYWLSESLVYHEKTGELLTNRTWTYKPPGAKDIPIDFRVTFLQKSSNEIGVLRSKATGEPPLCMSIVVLFALRHALESARKDSGIADSWFDLDGPASPDVILLKCNNSIESFKLN